MKKCWKLLVTFCMIFLVQCFLTAPAMAAMGRISILEKKSDIGNYTKQDFLDSTILPKNPVVVTAGTTKSICLVTPGEDTPDADHLNCTINSSTKTKVSNLPNSNPVNYITYDKMGKPLRFAIWDIKVPDNEEANELDLVFKAKDNSSQTTLKIYLVPVIERMEIAGVGETLTLPVGNSFDFSAVLSGKGNIGACCWKLENAPAGVTVKSSGTRFEKAKLTIGENAQSDEPFKLIVYCSTDTYKMDTVEIRLKWIDYIDYAIEGGRFEPGSTHYFTAIVVGSQGISQKVNWTVSGNTSMFTDISSTGVLTIGNDETAKQLVVRAYSTEFPDQYGEDMYNIHYHSAVKVKGQVATEEKSGWRDYYVCQTCEGYFEDAYCLSEITNFNAWKNGKGKVNYGDPQTPGTGSEQKPQPQKAPQAGDYLTDAKTGFGYTITDPKAKTAAFAGIQSGNPAKVVIPAEVVLDGTTYKVTGITNQAMKGNAALKQVVIGKNVTVIGKSAFANCKKLKTVKINTKKLTAKSVGAKAFAGIHASAKVKVPKAKLGSYKVILKKKGIKGKTQKIAP